AASHHLAPARHRGLRGGEGAEHQPGRGPLRRPGPRRADRAGPGRGTPLPAGDRRAERAPGGAGLHPAGPRYGGPADGGAGMTAVALSAGVLTADLTRLGAELEHLRGKAAWAHVDVMDGAFCPQLTVGPAFVAAVASTGIAVDAHLMVEEPRRMLADFAAAGAAVITVHAEATRHLHRTMTEMTALAASGRSFLRGVALNPGTPVCAVEPVLGLADLVLVLAVSPGWSGQEPAPGT